MINKAHGNSVLVGATLSSGIFAFSTFIGLVTALLVDLSKDMGTTVAAIGQLTTVTAVSWSVLAPLIGPWSDRIGHKRMLTIGLVVFGVSVIGYSISHTFWALIASSIFAGLGGAMVGPNVLACVADYYSANTYGRAMAGTNMASPLAYLVGVPGAVLIAGNLGWRWSFLSLAVFYLLCFLAVVIVLPSSQPHQSSKDATYSSLFNEALSDKTFLPMVIANTILQAAYWVVAVYLAAFLILSYTLTTSQLAPLISSMAMGQLVGVLAGGPLADKCSKLKICLLASILLGMTGLAFILFTQYVWLSVFWGGLFMGFYGVSRPAYFSLMALVSSTARGTVMGIQAVSNHLGRAVGAAVGGLVLSFAGYEFLGIICLILSVVASAMYLFLSFFMMKSPRGAASRF
jgi:predicted MFS family arabinose efflux permease